MQYGFEQMKHSVLEWYYDRFDVAQDKFNAVLTKNESDIILIDLSFKNCLAQIVVSDPFYAPYKYVSFETMTLDSTESQRTGYPELVYFFYDSDEFEEGEVIEELNIGFDFSLNYVPDELRRMYVSKKGTIDIRNKRLTREIHPDDFKKLPGVSLDGEFLCTDTQFQYLSVKNHSYSMRITPKIFNIVQ